MQTVLVKYKDCYLSVRIGSVQKLSRMTPSRSCYDFPETGGELQKYGRANLTEALTPILKVYHRVKK